MRMCEVMEHGITSVAPLTWRSHGLRSATFKASILALVILVLCAGTALAADESTAAADPATEPVFIDAAATAVQAAAEEVAVTADDVAAVEAGTAGAEEPAAVTAVIPAEEAGVVDGQTEAPAGENDAAPAVSEEKCCPQGEAPLVDTSCPEIEAILDLICLKGEDNVFWESKEDYDAGLLSMRYRLTNTSSDTTASNLRVVSATANNGVKVDTALPLALGALNPGETIEFLLKWQVPKGVSHFITDISICGDCEEFCADCPPPCEGNDCDPKPVCEGPRCNPPVDEGQQPPAAEPKLTVLTSSALPNTGLDLAVPLAVGLGLLLMGGLVPILKTVRERKR